MSRLSRILQDNSLTFYTIITLRCLLYQSSASNNNISPPVLNYSTKTIITTLTTHKGMLYLYTECKAIIITASKMQQRWPNMACLKLFNFHSFFLPVCYLHWNIPTNRPMFRVSCLRLTSKESFAALLNPILNGLINEAIFDKEHGQTALLLQLHVHTITARSARIIF